MRTTVLIPARYASTRYPGKPLAELRQKDGTRQSLIEMSWRAASRIAGVDAVHVVTDDDRIAEATRAFGGSVVMTSPERENGTARCAEAVANAGIEADVVINFQGDAPLTPPWFVEALIERMRDPQVQVATPVLRCDAQAYANFAEDRRNGRVGATTAVFGQDDRALYFSKEIVPYIAPGAVPETEIPVFHHVGVYAYRPAALAAYTSWPVSDLERIEGLEQLRFLVHGMPVTCVTVEARGRQFWELNNPEDVARIEAVLEAQS